MPCRNVLPKPRQKPHPPMWIACTNRDTIEVAARTGSVRWRSASSTPTRPSAWVDTYYDIIRSERVRPARAHGERQRCPGHRVLARSTIGPRRSGEARRASSSSGTPSTRWSPTTRCRAGPTSGASSRPGASPDVDEAAHRRREPRRTTTYAELHRHPRRRPTTPARARRRRRRSGDLPPTGRPQPPRRHLLVARSCSPPS